MTDAWTSGRRCYVKGRWGQTHVREWGEGRPIILFHQTPWSGVQFHRVGPLLAERGWRVIAPDTPGYGLSDPPPGPPSIGDYAAAAADLMQDMGLSEAVAGGHHTGALIAVALAAQTPERIQGLLLDNPPFYTEQERADRQAIPHHRHAPVEGGGHFTDRWAFLRRMADPNLSHETLNLALTAYYVNASQADHGHAAAYAWDMGSALERVRAPAAVLSSALDPVHHHAERLIALRPDWRLVRLDGGSANVLERPETWVRSADEGLAAAGATA